MVTVRPADPNWPNFGIPYRVLSCSAISWCSRRKCCLGVLCFLGYLLLGEWLCISLLVGGGDHHLHHLFFIFPSFIKLFFSSTYEFSWFWSLCRLPWPAGQGAVSTCGWFAACQGQTNTEFYLQNHFLALSVACVFIGEVANACLLKTCNVLLM